MPSDLLTKLEALISSLSRVSQTQQNSPVSAEYVVTYNNIREAVLIQRPELEMMVPLGFSLRNAKQLRTADVLYRCENLKRAILQPDSGTRTITDQRPGS